MGQIDARLVLSLVEGGFEVPPWNGFLQLLREVTNADFVTLQIRPTGRPIRDTLDLFSGNVPASVMMENMPNSFYGNGTPMDLKLEEGKVYNDQDLIELHSLEDESFRHFFSDLSVSDIMQIRLREHSGVDAWLTIILTKNKFSKRDVELVSSIGPALRGALRNFVALEREKYFRSLAAETTRRLQFGWLALDDEGQVLEGDEQGLQILEESDVLIKSPAGRLVATSKSIQNEILDALVKIKNNKRDRAYAVSLSRDPWLDMLLVPTTRRSLSSGPSPSVIAYVHGDSWHSSDCCVQLAELFTLTPSEAKLALAVCRGMTLSEAAQDLGIAISTVRSYSKSIYAKMGARGLPDLVRIVMRSVLSITPDSYL